MSLLIKQSLLTLNNTVSPNNVRYLCAKKMQSFRIVYSEFGDPAKVLQKCPFSPKEPAADEIQIKMIAAPLNPADINTIQGKYPIKPSSFPAVPGGEGFGEVVQLGSGAKDFSIGDRVIPLKVQVGTWQSHLTIPQDQLFKIPKTLGLVEAATMTVNPCTAYRMLKDFAQLEPDDVIIQNGANSACGQYVIQLCKAWGLKSVNIVRSRPNIDELRAHLIKLGAAHVLTEEELRSTQLFKSELPKPKLGLNCVGGKSALELIRHLGKGAPMVTYGGMSREPVTVPTSALIFKDVRVVGFWMSEWVKQNAESQQRFDMFDELICLSQDGKLVGPTCKLIDFDQFHEAIKQTVSPEGKTGQKFILKF